MVARIIEDKDVLRTFFLPDAYASKFRNSFEDPAEFNCYQMHLLFTGFRDEKNSIGPLLQFQYLGDAQHFDENVIIESE